GSVMPVSRSACRCSISGSNLEKRSFTDARSLAGLELLHRIDQLANGFDLRRAVHADQNVELVLDRGDEVHDGQAVPFEVLGEARRLADGEALLVEGIDQLAD